MFDWNALVQSTVEASFRNAPGIIIALGVVWRQNVKTRAIVADGFAEAALAKGKLQGMQESIPLAQADRKEFVQLIKDLTHTVSMLGTCAVPTHAAPHARLDECVNWKPI